MAWLRTLVGFGDGSWAVLTSGGVMANFMALTVARDIAPRAAARPGRAAARRARSTASASYASDQAHFSIARALDVLGFPPETLRVVASDERFRLHGDVVRAAVAEDRAAGLLPLCVAAVAGSTNTGSSTWSASWRTCARRRGCGSTSTPRTAAPAALEARSRRGSRTSNAPTRVTIDPHKWFFQAYDIGALVVRRRDDLLTTFHRAPEYYRHARPGGGAAQLVPVLDRGDPAVPRAEALGVLEAPGHQWLRAARSRTTTTWRRTSRPRAGRATTSRRCPTEPELSVVCFRHLPGGAEPRRVDPDGSTATRTGSSARWSRAARAGSRRRSSAGPNLPAGRDRELPVDARGRRSRAGGPPAPLAGRRRLIETSRPIRLTPGGSVPVGRHGLPDRAVSGPRQELGVHPGDEEGSSSEGTGNLVCTNRELRTVGSIDTGARSTERSGRAEGAPKGALPSSCCG